MQKLYYLITFFFVTPTAKVDCFAYAFSVSCFVSLLAVLWSSELLSCRGEEMKHLGDQQNSCEEGMAGAWNSWQREVSFLKLERTKSLKLLLQRTPVKREKKKKLFN